METTLTVLICVSTIAIVVIGGFLVKLLIDLSKLAQSATEITQILNEELEPTLKELREASNTLNSITGVASEQIINVNNAIRKVIDTSSLIKGKMQGLFDGFLKGIKVGMSLFGRKK